MLLDPSYADRSIVDGACEAWQPPRLAAPRHRSSPCVLTLPDIADDVPSGITLRWRAELAINDIVLEQFRHGPLRATDVQAPTSAADAFQQAFFIWMQRQIRQPLRFLSVTFELCDTNAVEDRIAYQDSDEFKPKGPLHLGVKLTDEWVHEIGPLAEPLRACHPLLLHTLFSLVDRVSGKTVLIRTPGWFLQEFACMHWEGDESAKDEDVRELLVAYHGADEETVERYLPSNVLPEIYPDEIRRPSKPDGRRSRRLALSERELLELQARCSGMPSKVCAELAALHRLLRRAGKRPLLNTGYDSRPIYSGCTLMLATNERSIEILDDYMNGEYQAGEATEYSCFIEFSRTKRGIREQYAQWSLAFQMLHHLDRLLALVVSP
ncbi:PRTRC system protein F [Paraburkholderia sp. CNPSo 3281]|uniref:PRTRC system protein F n=1 Tax=Paraburkholderia sp. CNPSo 3281 TaxID=2940933 RepID=UPI0020B71093|nr:PRTRC system protein F [Paraburkholderia sp. CNPSo 3281]MCP3718484.1 PRTRC system protein F [Paraburkholderia sp. CNPSo 3281]